MAKYLLPEDLVNITMVEWPQLWEEILPEQRVSFLTEIVTGNLGALLSDMSRQERAELLNALLPIIAREFPLAEADLLTVFASPGDYYAPQVLSEE
jgi:hypothetical protein